MSKEIESTSEFDAETTSGIVVVDFYGVWCNPCKMIAPLLDKVVDAKVVKVDVDEHPSIATLYKVNVLPTLVFLKDGVEKNRIQGAVNLNKIQGAVNDLVD